MLELTTFPLQSRDPSRIFELAVQDATPAMDPQDSGDSGNIVESTQQKTTANMDTCATDDVTLVNNIPTVNGAADTRSTKAQKKNGSNGFSESEKDPDVTVIQTISQNPLPCKQMDVKVQTTKAQNDCLEVAIVHAGQMENITVEQSLLVQEGIMAMVDDIPNGKFVPRFDKSYLAKGALKIVCADKESKQWIHERASDIQNWDGWDFRIVKVDELTKFVEVLLHVSKPQPEDTNLIFRRLERQNPGLCTARWIVTEKTEVDRCHPQSVPNTDRCLRLEVDEASLPVLESLDMRPYLGMGRAQFQLIGQQPAAKKCSESTSCLPPLT